MLPAVVDCPLCQAEQSLTVYDDPLLCSNWCGCRQCGFSGPPLELARRCWDFAGPELLERLPRLGLMHTQQTRTSGDVWRDFEKCILLPSQRIELFWQEAREHIVTGHFTTPTEKLRRRLGLLCSVEEARWREMMGDVVGISHIRLAPKLPHYVGRWNSVTRNKNPKSGQLKLRCGPHIGWGEIVVLRYSDVPGRTCGVVVVALEGRPVDQMYRSTWPPIHAGAKVDGMVDSGLMGLDLWLRRPWGDALLAPDLAAAALICQNTTLGDGPLPLLGWRLGSHRMPTHSTRMLGSARKIIWTNNPNSAELLLMIRENAHCSWTMTEFPEGLVAASKRKDPRRMCETAIAKARPWQEVVGPMLDAMPDATLRTVGGFFTNHPKHLDALIEALPSPQKDRLLQTTPRPAITRSVVLNDLRVHEADDQWVVYRGNVKRVLLDGVVRIDEIAHTKKARAAKTQAQKKRYLSRCRGVIRRRGKEARFETPLSDMRKNFQNWFEDACLESGLGLPSTVRRPSGMTFLDLAVAFHEPKVTLMQWKVGWDEETQSFHFPTGDLSRNGFFTPNANVFAPKSPGRRCRFNESPAEEELWDFVAAHGDLSGAVFTMLTYIVSQFLRPFHSGRPGKLLLRTVGEAQTVYPQILSGLGCVTADLVHFLWEFKHDWPTYVPRWTDRRYSAWRQQPGPSRLSIILAAPNQLANLFYAEGGCCLCEDAPFCDMSEQLMLRLPELVPYALRRLAQDGWRIEHDEFWLRGLHRTMLGWIKAPQRRLAIQTYLEKNFRYHEDADRRIASLLEAAGGKSMTVKPMEMMRKLKAPEKVMLHHIEQLLIEQGRLESQTTKPQLAWTIREAPLQCKGEKRDVVQSVRTPVFKTGDAGSSPVGPSDSALEEAS